MEPNQVGFSSKLTELHIGNYFIVYENRDAPLRRFEPFGISTRGESNAYEVGSPLRLATELGRAIIVTLEAP
jgi:hypothetical protein